MNFTLAGGRGTTGPASFEASKPSPAGAAVFDTRKPQSGGSAVFEAREKTPDYKGAERRRTHRRSQGDRREEMRFEPDKPDRRANPGRRADDKTPRFW